ncbi:hypothetical protein Tco_0335307 [Tanacetum coccineum]
MCCLPPSLITSLTSERDRLTSEVSTLHTAFQDFKEKVEAQQEEQAQVLYNRVAELEAHVMDVSGYLEGELYPAYLTTLAGRRWFLMHGIQLAVLKCFKSPEYQGILGHALGRAVDFGMQEGLEPSTQDDPSVNKVHGSGSSSGSVMSSFGDSSSGRSIIKSANIYPLIAVLGLYWISYPSSSNFHFSILPEISELDSSCFIGWSVITTIVCAWKYLFSRLLALSKANTSFSKGV